MTDLDHRAPRGTTPSAVRVWSVSAVFPRAEGSEEAPPRFPDSDIQDETAKGRTFDFDPGAEIFTVEFIAFKVKLKQKWALDAYLMLILEAGVTHQIPLECTSDDEIVYQCHMSMYGGGKGGATYPVKLWFNREDIEFARVFVSGRC